MAVEAFIYDYAATHFWDRFAKARLDRLDVVSKYVIITQLATGKTFPTDRHCSELLRRLIKSRNDLVHYKSSGGEMTTQAEYDEIAREEARWMRELVTKAEDAIAALDELADCLATQMSISAGLHFAVDEHRKLSTNDTAEASTQ